MNILLIEEEFNKSIQFFLSSEGYKVISVNNFLDAFEKISNSEYDCVIVEVQSSNWLSGIEQINEKFPKIGIIIISEENSLSNKIKGLDAGADDYLLKPIHLDELKARIKAIIRRRNLESNKTITINEILINVENRNVKVNDQEVFLTTKEYELLLYFVNNKNNILSKSQIAKHFLGEERTIQFDNYNFIYTHVKNLRKKLLKKGCADYIQTIHSIGYCFSIQP